MSTFAYNMYVGNRFYMAIILAPSTRADLNAGRAHNTAGANDKTLACQSASVPKPPSPRRELNRGSPDFKRKYYE